jgi:hypothetical protein
MKRNKKIGLGLIGVLCISAILFVAGMGLSERTTGGQSTEKETEKEVQFPYELEDGKVEVISLFQSSVSNPDSDNSYVENLASLELANYSEEHLQEATIELTMDDGEKLTFVLEEIPAGKTVWAFEVNNKCYETEQKIRKVECEATFTENTILLEEELNIEAEETLVSVKNISKETLKNLELKFHCLFDGVYYGGKTCTYQIDAIKADEEVSLDVWECYLGIADVVKIEK